MDRPQKAPRSNQHAAAGMTTTSSYSQRTAHPPGNRTYANCRSPRPHLHQDHEFIIALVGRPTVHHPAPCEAFDCVITAAAMATLLSRPQVGIERLPAARRLTTEHRESMNCKSCRKRKIKCNRLRPTCEACNVFQCPCVYDAVPKKRGPKTDVLEALLKRVDGLEKRLRDEKKSTSPILEGVSLPERNDGQESNITSHPTIDTSIVPEASIFSPVTPSEPSPTDRPDLLIDTYFLRVQDKPYHILDEATTRERHHLDQLPSFLRLAIYSVSVRFSNHATGQKAAIRLSEEYATQARNQLDADQPSIEGLQTLLLIHRAFLAIGKGRKSYMLLSNAISMAVALELHREVPARFKLSLAERELRRQLFWTCYLLDRSMACGTKRPSLIADEAIMLRLPAWSPHPGALPVEGEFFSMQSNFQYSSGPGRSGQGSLGMLIDIARILGVTNRYLAAGGVKGDSHFPWHSLSNLSKIRHALDVWASGNQDLFLNVEALFAQPNSITLVLSKLTYHLIHCLIYRPFLPINLAELRGTGQHQSWQIEATKLCFLHANVIAELAELWKLSHVMEWPAPVGYCLCTAGTVHVHGAHYKGSEGEIYSSSSDFLSREMHLLSDLRFMWAGAQHQRDTLQTMFTCHSELVKSLANNPLRYSPVFHLEDFFDRYPGQCFDSATVAFSDVELDAFSDSFATHDWIKSESTSSRAIHAIPSMGAQKPLPSATPIPQPKREPRGYTDQSALPSNTSSLPGEDPAVENSVASTTPQLSSIPEAVSPFNHLAHLDVASFSPSFGFSTLPPGIHGQEQPDPFFSMANDGVPNQNVGFGPEPSQQTTASPGAASQAGSAHTNETEKDPFLKLLEQLAENEHSRGGPSDLDYYLGEQESYDQFRQTQPGQ